MKKFYMVVIGLLFGMMMSSSVCFASNELAFHEEQKGIDKLPIIKRIDTNGISDKDIQMCVRWMQTDIGIWSCDYAESQGYNKYIMVSQIFSESRFAPTITSHSGAVGLMQILPAYASSYMNQVGATNLINSQDNVKTGICIMKYWESLSNGDVRVALAKYNGGSGGANSSACLGYANKILNRALAIEQTVNQN